MAVKATIFVFLSSFSLQISPRSGKIKRMFNAVPFLVVSGRVVYVRGHGFRWQAAAKCHSVLNIQRISGCESDRH